MNDNWKADLDNWITGHWGEDQFRDEEEGEPMKSEELYPRICRDCGASTEDSPCITICNSCIKKYRPEEEPEETYPDKESTEGRYGR